MFTPEIKQQIDQHGIRILKVVEQALQAGVDIPINDKGMGGTFDATRYFMKATTHFYTAGGVEALSTTHKLDPWVVSGGVYFRF